MGEPLKVGQKLDLALEDLLAPMVGHTVYIQLGDGQKVAVRIDSINNIHTAQVTITETGTKKPL